MTNRNTPEKTVTAALIVAGGTGIRFGGDLPKQYWLLNDLPVLSHSMKAFLEHAAIDHVLVVHGTGHERLYATAAAAFADHPGQQKLIPAICGGDTRQSSVFNGLEELALRKPDRVLIHDAARPLLTPATIDAVCDALKEHDAVLPATAVADTLKRVCTVTDTVLETVDRTALWQAQTPQGFAFDTIYTAHRNAAGHTATDDIALVENSGIKAKIVQGHPHNFKLTTQEDFLLAEALLPQRLPAESIENAQKHYG